MPNNKEITLDEVDMFVFDFDGVLTNNLVHVDQDGRELVSCSRADGLAFDVLRKLNKLVFILSTETNPVVAARTSKLKVDVIQGVDDKIESIVNLAKKYDVNLNRILYVGNDLNDFYVMQACGFSVCPADSHIKIKQIASVVLNTCGGNGVIRELLEHVLCIDFIKILYLDKGRV